MRSASDVEKAEEPIGGPVNSLPLLLPLNFFGSKLLG